MNIPEDWHLNPENKESKQLNEIVSSQARKLSKLVSQAQTDEEKYQAVYAFYRKFYTLTLSKSSVAAGINKSPARDIILDFPWKELQLNRFYCLKVWEKINH